MVTESVGNLEKGAWVQFRPEGIMYQITEIGKTRATLVDGEGNISTIPLRQAVYPLEAKPPMLEAVPEVKEPWQMTRTEWLADRERTSIAEGFGWSKEGEAHAAQLHKRAVQNALTANVYVPPEVLADYPDLKPPAILKAEAVPEVTPALERQRLITAAKEELSLLRSGLRRLEKERASEYTLKVQREGIIEAEQKIKQLQKLEVAIPTPPVVPTALSKQVIAEEGYHSNPEEKLPSDHELLLHFGIEEVGSPGVVLDEARARATPCSCFTYKGKDLCWSKGIIGLMTQEQQDVYCVAGKAYKAQPKLVERYTTFAEAAEEAHKKIEAMPKGRERLMTWLSAMGEELSKRGVEV